MALPLVLLAAPLLGATALLAGVVVSESAGASPFAVAPPANGAEAAALGEVGALVRYVRSGESPHRVHTVRPGLLPLGLHRATSAESALLSRRGEMVRLLDREGVIADPGLRHHLACLADDLDQEDVARYLVPEGPSCAGDAALARVTARSQ